MEKLGQFVVTGVKLICAHSCFLLRGEDDTSVDFAIASMKSLRSTFNIWTILADEWTIMKDRSYLWDLMNMLLHWITAEKTNLPIHLRLYS